jgi:tripartite-type tricarboxylate transporter receptor subunit TctC
MEQSRREFILSVLASNLACSGAAAQVYPNGPITLLVTYAAGGSADIAARLIAAALQQRLGKPLVIDNRPGGSEVVATEALVRSAPDGHTIGILSNAASINETLLSSRKYDLERDLAPVARLIEIPFAIMVHPSLPATTIGEFVQYARAHSGKLNYGHLGPGSPHYFVMEWFKKAAEIDMQGIPYRGAGPAFAALTTGEVQVIASGLGPATQFLESGQARALAAVSSTRPVSRPDLPTLAEVGYPEFDLNSWMGIFVRRGTPASILDRLQDEISAAIAEPEIMARLNRIGLQAAPLTGPAFAEFLKGSHEAWGRIVKTTGARPE